MKSVGVTLVVLCLVGFFAVPAAGQQGADEQVAVQLMLVDVLVTGENGEAVRGLVKDDFQMSVKEQIIPIDTLDEICPGSGPEVPGLAPRTVLLFDYYSLAPKDRQNVLDAAAQMLRQQKASEEQVMIAALTHDLRIEQRFTSNIADLLHALKRMGYDQTLGTRQFDYVSGKTYFENMATLMDVLAAYDGAKAILMFSSLATVPNEKEEWFRDLASRAGVANAVVYPTGLRGLTSRTPRAGTRALARFAADTGGLPGQRATEPAALYGRVQRELACRYSLGFYVDSAEARAPTDIRISVAKPGVKVRHPAQVRVWSPEETRASRMRAAFADPEQFDHPMIRTLAYLARPVSASTWETIVIVHGPVRVDSGEVELTASAEMWSGDRKLETFAKTMKVGPADSGSQIVPFTLFGEVETKPGTYQIRVAFSRSDEKDVVATVIEFEVPEVPTNELVVREPLLARVAEEGLAVRADGEPPVLLQQTIGEGRGFEPLTVNEIDSSDTLLVYWEACRRGKRPDVTDATVHRTIVDARGNPVHDLGAVPLTLEGDKVGCHVALERVDPGTLDSGEYAMQIAVRREGDRIALATTPLLVD